MGPRSSDRGNAKRQAEELAREVGLQWGRDHLIAEIYFWQPHYIIRGGFNGAAII